MSQSRKGVGTPSTPPCERGSCPPRPIPFIYVRMWVKKAAKCYKKVSNFCAAFWTNFACFFSRERKSSPTMGVGQWTSLLMTHEFRTTPSKLDRALPTLHPKHSNARGAIIRD